jgi:hypothetical protein
MRTSGTANCKEKSMTLKNWAVTIQQMVEESNNEPLESGKHKVLTGWRAKLSKEPHLLQPFQIDEIVREVRKGLKTVSQQPKGGPQARLFNLDESAVT